jgi:hypothetical protein
MGFGLYDTGSVLGKGRIFSLRHSVQTGSGTPRRLPEALFLEVNHQQGRPKVTFI